MGKRSYNPYDDEARRPVRRRSRIRPMTVAAVLIGTGLLAGVWLVVTLGQMMISHVLVNMWGGCLSFGAALGKAWGMKLIPGLAVGGGVGAAIAFAGRAMTGPSDRTDDRRDGYDERD